MKLSRLPISILVSLFLVALTYTWASALMDSLYAFRSPLHDNPPQPGEALGQPLTRRVVLVLIDALRADTAADARIMPYLDELRQQGASATMHSRPPSFSAPGYTVLFTGAWPDLSDGPALNPDYPDIPTWTQDNLFSAAHRAGLKTAISGYNFFEKLVPQDAVDASFYTAGEDRAADREVMDAAIPWLESGDYQLILIHIDQVDYAGHREGGPRDPRWNDAASRADDLVKEIASYLDLTKDTLIVFSDHGQIDIGGHGGHEPITLVEPFVAAGAGIHGNYGAIHRLINMIDVAPTVAALLGTNIPATSQGNVLTDMLVLPPGQASAIKEAVVAQQGTLLAAYTKAIEKPANFTSSAVTVDSVQQAMDEAKSSRLTAERIPRFIVVVLLFAAVGYFLWKNWKRNFLWMAVAAIVYALLFHFRYAVIAERTYSLSSVASADDIINFTLGTAFVSLAIVWWVLFTFLGAFKMEPRRAAEIVFELTGAVLLLLALPIAWMFAFNGPLIGWTLPDMPSMFLGFVCLLQALVVAAAGILLCGVTALIARYQYQPHPAPSSSRTRR
ncbi:MAG: alkaline phosphatase family protein [Chloroflexota bacterium]